MVFGTAVRLLGDPSEAEDVAQTVFLRAFERFETLRSSPAVGGWLKTVATNLCLNHLKRVRSRYRLFSQQRAGAGEAGPSFEESLASPSSQAADLERRQEHARLERGIRQLPDHQRVPLVLFHFQHRSYGEIAAVLGVSLAKVKTDIHRGRLALRRLIEASDDAR